MESLKIRPSKREPNHIQFISDVLYTLPYIKRLAKSNTTVVLGTLAKDLDYDIFSKGETVFLYGSVPNYFYLILFGEVAALVPKKLT